MLAFAIVLMVLTNVITKLLTEVKNVFFMLAIKNMEMKGKNFSLKN